MLNSLMFYVSRQERQKGRRHSESCLGVTEARGGRGIYERIDMCVGEVARRGSHGKGDGQGHHLGRPEGAAVEGFWTWSG